MLLLMRANIARRAFSTQKRSEKMAACGAAAAHKDMPYNMLRRQMEKAARW
jgi:hypothetical protein